MTKPSEQEIEKELIAIVKQLLAESGQAYQREIKLNASLQRHLGIDSLGRAELFQRIEKTFNVMVPDQLLMQAETLNDIATYLYTAKPHIKSKPQAQVIASHGEFSHVDPTRAKTLVDVLLMYAENSPDKAHIFFQAEDGSEEVITYDQLLKSALRVAYGLRERGLKEGETVAIMLPTHPGFFYTFLGTLLAGGIPVPIYPPFRMHMLEAYAKIERRILNNAEVRILVTFDQAETLSRLLQPFVRSLNHVTTVAELLQPQELQSISHPKSNHFAFIQYTSGSTADPKGVLLTHHNLLANIQGYGKAIAVTPEDVAVSWLPLYHDMGLIGMWLGSLYYGIPLILLTPFTFLNHPERWLWTMHYHRGTLSGAPNFAYELCIRKIDASLIEGLDLSSWRIAANGAEKIYPHTLKQFADKFANYGFKRQALLPVYGLAESTVALTIPPLNREFRLDDVERKEFEEKRLANPATENNALTFVSCGVPLAGHEIRIVDDEGNVLPERHVGNLEFRGPSSMQGYYNNSRATQAVYHEGWFDTGDLAYQAEGELFITGRRKDLIIKAGRNLYPAEIEELVGNVPDVRQGCVAAFGAIDAKRGTEQLIIVAETREKNKNNREQIIDNIQETISVNLDIVPDRIILVPPHTVPKTSSGKLQRAACKTLYLNGKLSKIHLPAWWQIAKLVISSALRKILTALTVTGKFVFTVYIILLFLSTFLPLYVVVRFSSRSRAATACRIWARLLLIMACCPVRIVGLEKLTSTTPLIFASNHASYVDALVALAFIPLNTHFVGKKELFSAPIIRTFMRKLDCVAVDRMDLTKGLEDTQHVENKLKTGDPIYIFPEGTFGYSSGLRPFRLGAFKISVETNVAVCPIALQGTRAILRDDEKLIRPGRITVTICDPIRARGHEWQDVTQLRNAVRAEIAKYCGEPTLDFIAAQTVAPKHR